MPYQPRMALENTILVHLSQVELDEADVLRIRELANRKIDWSYIVRKAVENFVFPQVYHGLRKVSTIFRDSSLDDLLERIKPIWHGMLAGNLALYTELKKILEELKARGVLFMPIKGVALGEMIYPSRDLRYMSDIDLLFKDKQGIEEAKEVLTALGYSYSLHHSAFSLDYVRKGYYSTKFDLHLFFPGWSDYYSFPRIDSLWDTALVANIEGVETHAMTPENMFMIIALHSIRDCTFTLRDFCDARTILEKTPGFDWDIIRHYFSQEGWRYVLPPFLYMLRSTHMLVREHSSVVFPKWVELIAIEEGNLEYPRSYSSFCKRCSLGNYCPIFFKKKLRKKYLQLEGTLQIKPASGLAAAIIRISCYFWESLLLFRFFQPRRKILRVFLAMTKKVSLSLARGIIKAISE